MSYTSVLVSPGSKELYLGRKILLPFFLHRKDLEGYVPKRILYSFRKIKKVLLKVVLFFHSLKNCILH